MKFYKAIFLATAFLFTWSCSNDFDLIDEKTETPVLYCLLDYTADNQYVRLERSFVSPSIAADILAKNPDSLYYKNAVVTFRKTSKGVTTSHLLKEVDGADEGYPRKDGVFATSPNKLYKITSGEMPLLPGDVVEIEANIGEGQPIKSTITVIQKANSNIPNPAKPLDFSPTIPYVFKWNHIGGNKGVIFSINMVFNYTEVQAGNVIQKSLVWPIAKNIEKEQFALTPGEFYTFLGNNLSKDQDIKRYLDGIDYYIHSGDINLFNYLSVGLANTGITSSGEIPQYTNLSRGFGLFGSKAVLELKGLGINATTFDALKSNNLTKDLNFQ